MYKAAIIDLDGTLVDSLADLADATNYALDTFGQPQRDLEAIRQMVGQGTRMLISRALEPDKQGLIDKVLPKMREKYAQICLNKTKPYEGIPEVITELSKRGIRLAVLTNKDEEISKKIVNHFFNDYFDVVTGTTNSLSVKPESTYALRILNRFEIQPGEVIFIGDSDIDMQTAKACNIFAAGVSWGFGSREELTRAGANAVIDEPKQLLKLFM